MYCFRVRNFSNSNIASVLILCACGVDVVCDFGIMASFSLEDEAFFFSQKPNEDVANDPFRVLNNSGLHNNSGISVEAHYSDISDAEDFQIPCSQRRSAERSVLFFWGFHLDLFVNLIILLTARLILVSF